MIQDPLQDGQIAHKLPIHKNLIILGIHLKWMKISSFLNLIYLKNNKNNKMIKSQYKNKKLKIIQHLLNNAINYLISLPILEQFLFNIILQMELNYSKWKKRMLINLGLESVSK